ncbi:MAG: NUDIX domain-containing protein [Acidimicrobiales bacterium]
MDEKVVAYIARGDEVLVFLHVDDRDPVLESGLQVPAGTVEPGEEPSAAVLREAAEETGLDGLEMVRSLGSDEPRWPGAPPQRRHFFQLSVADAPEAWEHVERDGGGGPARPFRLFWMSIGQAAPLLAAGQGLCAALIRS